MPKVFENDIVYDWNPAHVLSKLHQKYPNPYATHVHSVDTLERTIDPETGIIRSERIVGVVQGAPGWITKLFHLPPTAYVREVIFVDPSIPKATCMSVNLSLAQYVSCLELITYNPHPSPSNPSDPPPEPGHLGPLAVVPQTIFNQRALITSGFPTAMVARRVEKASVDRFGKNAGLGKRGFDWVLNGGSDPKTASKR
ncbi:putative mitochondrion protein [Naematelia encephala]|uniref:Putative mitochondrion protein n=1 Tax=Naematelia encephala TaxID=71784 RepID=A0A1Y2BLZ3_9TREE|nr:putative mitochondrion protein [Naematelia encephala]